MTTSKTSVADLNSMLNSAVDDGILSPATRDLINLNDSIALGASGMNVDDIMSTDVTLVTLLIDNTGSIHYKRLTDAVINGQNEIVEAFTNSKQKDSIKMAQWYMNVKEPLHSYISLDNVTKLNNGNYQPNGGTPLYDRTFEAITANVAYAQQLRDTGTPVTNVIVIVTDGIDEGSRTYRAADVARLVNDVMREQFAVVMVGVGSNHDEFKRVGMSMGIPEGNILTVDATPSDIRRACHMVSQSTIRASQTQIDPSNNNAFFV